MNRPLNLWPAAIEDMKCSFDWYEDQRPGLGHDFIAEVECMLNEVASSPYRFAKANRRAREALVKRFPFAIYFVPTRTTIDVITVFHTSRDPREWQKRLSR